MASTSNPHMTSDLQQSSSTLASSVSAVEGVEDKSSTIRGGTNASRGKGKGKARARMDSNGGEGSSLTLSKGKGKAKDDVSETVSDQVEFSEAMAQNENGWRVDEERFERKGGSSSSSTPPVPFASDRRSTPATILHHPQAVRPSPVLSDAPTDSALRPPLPQDVSSRSLTPEVGKSRRPFSRTLSQLSLSSFKSRSRPSTPSSPSPVFGSSSYTMGASTPEKGKGKAKIRQLLRLDSNKIVPSSPRPLTPLAATSTDYFGSYSQVSRVASRHRSHSAPLLYSTSNERGYLSPPYLGSDDVVDPISPSVDPLSTYVSPISTPYHSAVSSPLLEAFSFPSSIYAEGLEEPKKPIDVFAHYLPLELQIKVMQSLLEVCEEDWRDEVKGGEWKGERARGRWSQGEVRGRRELARVGRVSRSWRHLSLNGQLWQTAPLSTNVEANTLSKYSMTTMFDESGSYVRNLNLQGLGSSLDWTTLDKIIIGARGGGVYSSTNFTSINLTGCTSLTSSSITNLLSHCPHLVELNLFALHTVVSVHIATLASSCPRLESLDVSRCRNLPAASILLLYPPPLPPTSTSYRDRAPRGLKVLKIAALPGTTDDLVVDLVLASEGLNLLDLSFSPRVTDDTFLRITSSSANSGYLPSNVFQHINARHSRRPSQLAETLVTTSRTSTSPPSSRSNTKRLLPHLRQLNLSGCTSLTSRSFSHLAGSLPSLETFEISRNSNALRDSEQVAKFLASCRELRKVDFEDGIELSDAALDALIPSFGSAPSRLEHLVINTCVALTNDAIKRVVQGCPNLRILEADSTEISDRTAREFVQLAKDRATIAQKVVAAQEPTKVLVEDETPAVLSILDNRVVGRRLHRELGGNIRPRTGHRGWWTRWVGFYHEEEPVEEEGGDRAWKKEKLAECDYERVVVRSFHSSLAVDAANALRQAKGEREGTGSGPGSSRTRAMSDSILTRGRRGGGGGGMFDDEAGSAVACTIM